jgi:hypothetical protein
VTPERELRDVVGALDRAGIAYMMTGSFASSYHAAPRATQDIDVVILVTADQIRSFVEALSAAGYCVDENAALRALKEERQFIVVSRSSGWKVDLIVRKSRPFSRLEFDRRQVVAFHDLEIAMVTAEDLIVAKLEWTKRGGSARQIEDAAGILKMRSDDLDHEHIREWVRTLDLTAEWKEACRIAELNG